MRRINKANDIESKISLSRGYLFIEILSNGKEIEKKKKRMKGDRFIKIRITG